MNISFKLATESDANSIGTKNENRYYVYYLNNNQPSFFYTSRSPIEIQLEQ